MRQLVELGKKTPAENFVKEKTSEESQRHFENHYKNVHKVTKKAAKAAAKSRGLIADARRIVQEAQRVIQGLHDQAVPAAAISVAVEAIDHALQNPDQEDLSNSALVQAIAAHTAVYDGWFTYYKSLEEALRQVNYCGAGPGVLSSAILALETVIRGGLPSPYVFTPYVEALAIVRSVFENLRNTCNKWWHGRIAAAKHTFDGCDPKPAEPSITLVQVHDLLRAPSEEVTVKDFEKLAADTLKNHQDKKVKQLTEQFGSEEQVQFQRGMGRSTNCQEADHEYLRLQQFELEGVQQLRKDIGDLMITFPLSKKIYEEAVKNPTDSKPEGLTVSILTTRDVITAVERLDLFRTYNTVENRHQLRVFVGHLSPLVEQVKSSSDYIVEKFYEWWKERVRSLNSKATESMCFSSSGGAPYNVVVPKEVTEAQDPKKFPEPFPLVLVQLMYLYPLLFRRRRTDSPRLPPPRNKQ